MAPFAEITDRLSGLFAIAIVEHDVAVALGKMTPHEMDLPFDYVWPVEGHRGNNDIQECLFVTEQKRFRRGLAQEAKCSYPVAEPFPELWRRIQPAPVFDRDVEIVVS
ncbi:MAG: hypothetical protein AB1440_26845, partial [Pseudomonadota bacterium]